MSRRFLSGSLRRSFPLITRQSKAMKRGGVETSSFGRSRSHIFPMLRPLNERRVLERELHEELPAQLAVYEYELAAGQADKVRREQVEWQMRRIEKRMVTVRT
jgi:acetyl-CoA carboxylase beta subunit